MEKTSSPTDKQLEKRIVKFNEALNFEVINLDKLRSLSWLGIPSSIFYIT